MQYIMQILHEDHINVARLLDLMETIMEELHTGNLARLDVACKTMRYMTAYPDHYHHPTEDVLLRRMLARAAESQAVINRLLDEHQIIGAAGSNLRDQLNTPMEQGLEPAPDLIQNGFAYIAQLRDHMNTEEGEIFPLAKVILSRLDWESLHETIATVRDPLFGAAVQKSYQNLARALADSIKP